MKIDSFCGLLAPGSPMSRKLVHIDAVVVVVCATARDENVYFSLIAAVQESDNRKRVEHVAKNHCESF